jgi:hypothetical protein
VSESSGADSEAILFEQLIAHSRLGDEGDKLSGEVCMEMIHPAKCVNAVVEPAAATVDDVHESRVVGSRSATPLPAPGPEPNRRRLSQWRPTTKRSRSLHWTCPSLARTLA